MADNTGEKIDIHLLRHDVNNQLSNINLCLEQLKYEVTDQTEDYRFYLEAIAISCKKIQEILADK
ncbi:hypothetical protein LJ707_05410 [Mucilaginibacter sp. UR6-1]|uniref:hypothetical protein n=1 Tax=Mucilaginibacter sp. UR6-1 TaxID=1435643 RepID=UPI001E2A8F3B|nr:hypothetical protein [Mucilaginibacter sp. UR6-1]MCC8408357.1 hypothetical protein [Mucilaginibacter sp. UR6-1]